MKKLFLLLVTCLSTAFTFAQTESKSIEFEPRVGASILTSFERGGGSVGYKLGGMVAFPITEKFYINPGMTFFGSSGNGDNIGLLQIPVYASYRIPMGNTRLRLNAGPYLQLGTEYGLGISAEAGIEYKRMYGAVDFHQNMVTPYDLYSFLGLSLGYKFTLK